MLTTKRFLLKSHFDGTPKESDFKFIEETLSPLGPDEILCENLYLSVDPYMRVYTQRLKTDSLMVGSGVARVIESNNLSVKVGTIVTGPCGWTTHYIPNKTMFDKLYRVVPPNINPSHAIGVLGLTGLTAYFGLLEICEPKAGETVFVNTAAGAVGSIVGQLAKIRGCRVVGCAGTDEKVTYLLETLAFDGAFNYKTDIVENKLRQLCPKGIDCFFDNVGGGMFDTVMEQMNRFGRVAACGALSLYNEKDPNKVKGPYIHNYIIPKDLKIQGFNAPSYYKRYDEGVKALNSWIKEGKIKFEEHIFEGFESMPSAFIGLFTGVNIGKVIVKV